ncbi:MAG: DUF4012 domain-containing protein [Candidatus Yanofskybacteria bacterium]|nr:DUF4012 domain-containing protein [Candidatus Yanofskybacteria bacterium]
MPRSKYQVIAALFDIKPINENGDIDLDKISGVESLLNLGRKLRIGKFGQPALKKPNIKYQISGLKHKEKGSEEIQNTKYELQDTIPDDDFQKYLNEDLNPTVELAAIGAEMVERTNLKPRYKPIRRSTGQVESSKEEPAKEEGFDDILSQINQKITPADNGMPIGEPKKMDVMDWWDQKLKNQNEKIKITEPEIKPIRFIKFSSRKLIIGGLALMMIGLFAEYGFSLTNEIVHKGNSAVSNLESAGENIKKLDFTAASTNFAQAYSDFVEAGNNLNFMGATMSSLIADLPGGGKLKSAKKLVEAGKLMADAGQAMSRAMEELAKTNTILFPALTTSDVVATSDVNSIGGISQDLRQALTLSQKNIKEAGELLEDVDANSLPEDKRASFDEFNSKLPEFEKMITDAVDYSKFLEDFIGTAGTKKYLFLFQNPAELRPTGGFPGSYGVVVFKDGRLQDFRVDDVYNLDGQLKELYVPPLQLQHITPNWAMRDANWFVDFPVSAGKISEFYKKESGEDVDGVITFSPQIVSKILEITGPIRMDKYGVTLNSDNFSQAIQEEVEYNADKNQPKKILVDLAPRMLEEIYSADSDRWMEIFNILVSSVDKKDILMYFRDLKLQDFSVTKGFSGQINQTQDDYLMVTLTNVKGSKTDSVIDSELKVDTIFDGDDVRHRVVLTRLFRIMPNFSEFPEIQNPISNRFLITPKPISSVMRTWSGSKRRVIMTAKPV